MKVLIFEYATAVGFDDPSLLYEGRAILEGLLEDFQKLNNNDNNNNKDNSNDNGSEKHEIFYLIAPQFLNPEYKIKWPSLTPLTLEEELIVWLEKNISSFEGCIFMAAEENMELYDFTSLIEDKGVKILGSSSQAVMTCSDKSKTYEHLRGKVPLINTHKLFLKDITPSDFNKTPNSLNAHDSPDSPDSPKPLNSKDEKNLRDKYGEITALFDSGFQMVVKPADGVACQGISIVESWRELIESLESIETALPYVMVQNFVEGESCSVSLLCDGQKAYPLSLNRQKIAFNKQGLEYGGGEVPWEHPLSSKAFEVAKSAVESINGLKGFVGVDLILSDQVYLVEINSRLTTPYVALRRLLNFNLVQCILDACQGHLLTENLNLNDFKGKASFKKTDSELEIKIL